MEKRSSMSVTKGQGTLVLQISLDHCEFALWLKHKTDQNINRIRLQIKNKDYNVCLAMPRYLAIASSRANPEIYMKFRKQGQAFYDE